MKNKTRRTEIQIETHEVKVIRLGGRQFRVYCEFCHSIVAAFTPVQVAELLQMSPDNALGLVNDGKLHLVQADRGFALVCGNSLDNKNKAMVLKASPNQL